MPVTATVADLLAVSFPSYPSQTWSKLCQTSGQAHRFVYNHDGLQGYGALYAETVWLAGDRPFLLSGADDRLAKVWDYQTKACVQTLEGHAHNVSAVMFHPELPVILTGSEDGTVRIWHSNTYRLESTLNYGLERVWALGYIKGSNSCALPPTVPCFRDVLSQDITSWNGHAMLTRAST